MTNTGDDGAVREDPAPRVARTKHVLLAVLVVWLLAALIGLAQWLPGDDRQPGDLLELVLGTAIPGLIAMAVALAVLRWTNTRR